MLFGKRFCRIKLVVDLQSFASIAKEKFPNFSSEEFKSNEICDATKQLPKHFEKHSKHCCSIQEFHHVAIESKKVVGYFLTKTHPCLHQIKQNQEKVESDAVVQMVDTEKSISPTESQFCKVRYSFLYRKGGKVVQVLPAMCSKNNLEEHLFRFLKSIQQNHYLLNDSDQAWVIERDIHEVLPFTNLTRRGEYKQEDKILKFYGRCYLGFYFELNLLGYYIIDK